MHQARSSHSLIRLLLVAIAFRALVPAGFMPSGEAPFALQICPVGFPAHLLRDSPLAHAHHDGPVGHSHYQQDDSSGDPDRSGAEYTDPACAFALLIGAGPLASSAVAAVVPSADTRSPSVGAAIPSSARQYVPQQPRAPPAIQA